MKTFLDNAVIEYSYNGQINYHTTEKMRELVMASNHDYFAAAAYLDSQYGISI